MEVGRPGHTTEVGELSNVGPIELHCENVGDDAVRFETTPQDTLTVGREERAAIIAGGVREPAKVRTVGMHQVQIAEVGLVHVKPLLVLVRERLGVRVAI